MIDKDANNVIERGTKLRVHLLPWNREKAICRMSCVSISGLLAVAVFGVASTILGCGLSGNSDQGFAGLLLNGLLANCPKRPNGCGPAGILGTVVPECPVSPACFIDACDEHDGCYRRCGIDRSTCDTEFHSDMLTACSDTFSEGDPMLDRCETVAFIYVEVVDRLGSGVFQFTQTLGCLCEAVDALGATPKVSSSGIERRVSPFVDKDDDLLPDDWENENGLDSNDPFDAMQDYDGDGLINLVEFILDSDPFDVPVP